MYNLLKGKKGIIFGALDENSIAWKTAERVHEEGGQFVLTNAPVAMRMGKINDLAEKTAAKVKETGREYVMDPMTNSQRKIIHKALSQIEGVESHSEGDDPNRYVVVTKV